MTLLRNRATRLMIVVFIAFLAFAFIVNLARQRGAAPAPTLPPPPVFFLDVFPTDITVIEIRDRLSGRTRTFSRIPGDWIVTDETGKPLDFEVAKMGPILQILSTLAYERKLDNSSSDLKQFGLSEGGIYTVKFEAVGRSHTIQVGDINPASQLSYIQVEPSSAVYQVDVRGIARVVSLLGDDLSTATLPPDATADPSAVATEAAPVAPASSATASVTVSATATFVAAPTSTAGNATPELATATQ